MLTLLIDTLLIHPFNLSTPSFVIIALKAKRLHDRTELAKIAEVLVPSNTMDSINHDGNGTSSVPTEGGSHGNNHRSWFRSTYARVFVGLDSTVGTSSSPQMITASLGKNGTSGVTSGVTPYNGRGGRSRSGSLAGCESSEVSPVNSTPVTPRGRGPDGGDTLGHANARRQTINSGKIHISPIYTFDQRIFAHCNFHKPSHNTLSFNIHSLNILFIPPFILTHLIIIIIIIIAHDNHRYDDSFFDDGCCETQRKNTA